MQARFYVATETRRESFVFPPKLQASDADAAAWACMGVVVGISARNRGWCRAWVQVQRLAYSALPIPPASRSTLKCPILNGVVHERHLRRMTDGTGADILKIDGGPFALHICISFDPTQVSANITHPQTLSASGAPKILRKPALSQTAGPHFPNRRWCLSRSGVPRCRLGIDPMLRHQKPSLQ